ncbi:PSD1 and planctomycete cytochrome C domain-containing protein [Thalassoglobus sp.]|uniref:PSD1 and planctomycete cytochrome C domain-containing protein n=1 Tax=Thalassoglobus sp. TaxID=2795869 RepID=UPI003AA7AE1F
MPTNHFAVAACCLLGSLIGSVSLADESEVLFERDIQPIFTKSCGKCHSEKVRKGGLNASSMAGLVKGGESGESAIADSVDESMLWIMLDGGGMPPEDQPQLTQQELEKIRLWLSQGAKSERPVSIEEEKLSQHDVLPILHLRCVSCHGAQRQDGKLDLRSPESILKGGESGPALIAGKPDESLMIQRVESEACPPHRLLLKFFVRRPPNSELEKLKEWISAGAPVLDIKPDIATREPDLLVTDEDRQHWAFQTPEVNSDKNSVDDFILSKLKENQLTFSPEADRSTLIRRAYIDLIGIPPSVAEWEKWRTSSAVDWYQQMIEELLASPHYGERWGRYWLDVAGYADSEGGVSADPIRPVAWKYRDYVVRSFNEDKPYDRFLLEQIAGDELLDAERASVVTEEMVNNLIATGFLRMGIDQTGSRTMNYVPERIGVISDAIQVLGSGVMGLTMGCARCHSHKYDPIPHRDYYRFKAIFKGAFDEHDWLSFKNRKLDIATQEHLERIQAVNPQVLKELKSLQNELKKATAAAQIAVLKSHHPEQSEADRTATLAALKIADNNRTLPQRILVEKLIRADLLPDEEQPEAVLAARLKTQQLEKEIQLVQSKLVPPATIRALWDRGQPTPTYVLLRGEHNNPGTFVGPGVPSVLTDGQTPFEYAPPFPDGTPKTGQRLAFARWLTQPDHPLTARVMVNRIWYHHFGTGIVASLDNFGKKGERPSHPELLDWLAVEFMQRGWSIKEMHRLIMNSQTYRQASRVTEQHLERDPSNILLSRMPMRRMNAEALRDSTLFISGKLDFSPGGPPDSVSIDRDGLVSANPTSTGGWRRSLYVQYRRTEIPTMMETFDYPEMGPNCVSRTVSIVSPQSLMLMNNSRVYELSQILAKRVRDELPGSDKDNLEKQIEHVYELMLSRRPTDQEKQVGIEAIKELQMLSESDGEAPQPLETYCHTILNSAAFLYID